MTCLTYLRTLTLAPAAVVVCCLLLAVGKSTSRAAVIEYSWEGTIEPLDPNVDPWRIGAEGKPFVITGTVDEIAVDFDTDVRDARFILSEAVVLIDGVSATALNGGNVFFGDRESRDLISFSLGEVLFGGVREDFFTGVTLPTSTFTLTNIAEAPPVFPATTTITGGGSLGDGSSYFTTTDAGANVIAKIIPEPSPVVLSLLAMLILGTRLFWRRLVV